MRAEKGGLEQEMKTDRQTDRGGGGGGKTNKKGRWAKWEDYLGIRNWKERSP